MANPVQRVFAAWTGCPAVRARPETWARRVRPDFPECPEPREIAVPMAAKEPRDFKVSRFYKGQGYFKVKVVIYVLF